MFGNNKDEDIKLEGKRIGVDDDLDLKGKDLDELTDEDLDKAVKGDEDQGDKSSASSAEKNAKTEPSSQGEDGAKGSGAKNPADKFKDYPPLDEHPRFKELAFEKRKLQEDFEKHKQATEKRFEEMQKPKAPESVQTPDWWVKLYGDTPESKEGWKIYNEHRVKELEEAETRAVKRIKDEQNQISERQNSWNTWVNFQLDELKASGKEFDRNQFLKFMIDYKPTDDKGGLDFKKGMDLYEKINPKKDTSKTEIKKKISEDTQKGSSSANTGDKIMTSRELRNRSFTSLAEDS